MLSTIPSRRHSSAIAYSPRRPDNTIRIFSSAEYRLRVARRISRTCCSAVSDGTDFCLIFAPSRATMSQKSSLRKIPQSVSQLLTGNIRQKVPDFPYGLDHLSLAHTSFGPWKMRDDLTQDELGSRIVGTDKFQCEIDIPVSVVLEIRAGLPLRPIVPLLHALVDTARETIKIIRDAAT